MAMMNECTSCSNTSSSSVADLEPKKARRQRAAGRAHALPAHIERRRGRTETVAKTAIGLNPPRDTVTHQLLGQKQAHIGLPQVWKSQRLRTARRLSPRKALAARSLEQKDLYEPELESSDSHASPLVAARWESYTTSSVRHASHEALKGQTPKSWDVK